MKKTTTTMADYVRTFNLPTALWYLDRVVDATARTLGVPFTDIFGPKRDGPTSVARRLALEVFREKYPYFPSPYVAKAFKRTNQWANWTRRETMVERKWLPVKQGIRDTLAEALAKGPQTNHTNSTVDWDAAIQADVEDNMS
jgi:hypothetical protein